MKKALLGTVLVCSVLASPVMAMAADVAKTEAAKAPESPVTDALKYSMEDWDPALIAFLEGGPGVLPPDFKVDLPPYPANTSDETKAELAALKQFAAQERTPEALEKIRYENTMMPVYQAFSHYGLYDFEKAPITNSLLASVDRDVSVFLLAAKKDMQRPRPTQLDPALTTAIPVPRHSAYPSGHAAQSYASALVLGMVDPKNAGKYIQIALDVAHRREVAGVHFPSDSAAGHMLAEQVVKALFEKPEIQKRLALAQKEFAASH